MNFNINDTVIIKGGCRGKILSITSQLENPRGKLYVVKILAEGMAPVWANGDNITVHKGDEWDFYSDELALASKEVEQVFGEILDNI